MNNNNSKLDRKRYDYDSMLVMFDEYVSNGRGKSTSGRSSTSRPLDHRYEFGDLVWAKVKSYPWWPGHVYNEAFAPPSARRTKRDGHLMVAFFGDGSYGWFGPDELIPFDSYFHEKSRQTNSRNFVKALEEAIDEAGKRCGLGLACRCRNPNCVVDVAGYEPRGFYSEDQIRKARDGYQPAESLAFVKQLALMPLGCEHLSIHSMKNKATVLACRRAVFEEFDETYAQALRDPLETMPQLLKDPSRGANQDVERKRKLPMYEESNISSRSEYKKTKIEHSPPHSQSYPVKIDSAMRCKSEAIRPCDFCTETEACMTHHEDVRKETDIPEKNTKEDFRSEQRMEVGNDDAIAATPNLLQEIIQAKTESSLGCGVHRAHEPVKVVMVEQTAGNTLQPVQSKSQPNSEESINLGKHPVLMVTSSVIQKCSDQMRNTGKASEALILGNTQNAPISSALVPSAICKSEASALEIEGTSSPESQVLLTSRAQREDKGERMSIHVQSLCPSIATSILNVANAFDELQYDEACSGNSIKIGRYTMTPSLAPILQAIMDSYGDIALECPLTDFMCSYALENICEAVQKIQYVPFVKLRSHHLETLNSAVTEAEQFGLRVDWLRRRHDELKETVLMLKNFKRLKNDVVENVKVAESIKADLESKKAELMKLQHECESLESQLASRVAEIDGHRKAIANVITKCNRFGNKTLLDGLL